jgi:predicted alpha/beta hydrolase family esterase
MRPALAITLEVIGFAAAGVALAVLLYALGSFVLMRPHTSVRTAGAWLRALLSEIALAGITQLLLPLYYVVGHRMEPLFRRRRAREADDPERDHPREVPVIFVHGYMHNRIGFLGLARNLARRGIGPLYGFNYPWFTSIASNASRLERFIDRVCDRTKASAVDLVCHSMGGLVAAEMMRTAAAKDTLRVRRCVTIATPHAGITWRGPLFGVGATSLRRGSKFLAAHAGQTLVVPTLSIFSSHDNIVHPKETSHLTKRGGRDVEVEGPGHLSLLFSREVANQVASFLSDAQQTTNEALAPMSPSPIPVPRVM